MVSALPEDVKVALATLEHPFINMNARQILQALRDTFGPIQASDLANQMTLMRTPLQMGKVKEFIAVHMQAHYVHACTRQQMTDHTKVQLMKDAIEACPAYSQCVTMYNHDFPEAEAQTF